MFISPRNDSNSYFKKVNTGNHQFYILTLGPNLISDFFLL